MDISHGGYLEKQVKGMLSAKWQKRYFHLDYNKGALVHYKNEKKLAKEYKEKMKLSDLHGVDLVENVITVIGSNTEVLVLRAPDTKQAAPWFAALNKDFEEAKRIREERLMKEAAERAEKEANARGQKKFDEMDEEHRKKQQEMERANAEKLAEQQRLLDEQKIAREAKEAELAKLHADQDSEKARLEAKAKLEAEEAEKAKLEAEEKAKLEATEQAKAKAAAEAKSKKEAEAKARAAAAAQAKLDAEALAKLDRNARFSGPNSIYHEAPTTWVDYPIITKNEEISLRNSQNAKLAANEWLSQRAKARAKAP